MLLIIFILISMLMLPLTISLVSSSLLIRNRLVLLNVKKFRPIEEDNDSTKEFKSISVGTGAKYFSEISNIFESNNAMYSKDNVLKLEAQNTLIREIRQFTNDNNINGAHMSAIIQKCAKAKIDVTTVFDMETILLKLNVKSRTEGLNAIELAQLMYGIRGLNSFNATDVNLYLDFACKKVIESNDPWRGRELGNALFGLQNLENSWNVDQLLNAIANKINAQVDTIPITLNGQEFSNALFGMRKLNSDSIATLNLLDSIRIIVEKSNNIVLNQQGFGNSLNGLQGMSSDEKIVRSFLITIIPFIENADLISSPLTDRGVCGALMGLRSMNSCPEVLKLISIITIKFKESNVCLTNNHISHALSSLKNFDNKNKEIKELLSVITQRVIPNHNPEVKGWSPEIISNSLMGLQKMTLHPSAANNQDLNNLLQMISAHLSTSSDPRDYFTSIDISRSLLGMYSIDAAKSDAIKTIIGKLAVEIEKSNGIIKLSARDIGRGMFGLRAQVDSSLPEIKSILSALTKSIMLNKESSFSPQVMTMAMLGLSSLSPSQELYRIVYALSDKLAKIDAASIGSLIFSFKKMSSDAPEVKVFLKKLTPLIVSCQLRQLTSQELANAYYGLSNFDNEHIEVVDLIRALNEKLLESKTSIQFTAQGISNSISGFQSMQLNTSDDVINTALEILADKLEECKDDFSAVNIANVIFGLQGMSSEVEGARAVLQAILPKMVSSTEKFTERDIGYCLAGLSSMQANSVCDESQAVLSELNFKVVQSGFGDQAVVKVKMYGKGVRLVK